MHRMAAWERYRWVEEATEATVALVAGAVPTAEGFLGRLGAVEPQGEMTFDVALELQNSLYGDGSFDERAVFQATKLPGDGGDSWATLEPNGFRASIGRTLQSLAAEHQAVSHFWNVNAVMSLVRVQDGQVVAAFDPMIEVDHVPEEGRDLPFGEHPGAAALALMERWTGVSITEEWFVGSKPTFLVHTPSR
jgi:hypothetical protein